MNDNRTAALRELTADEVRTRIRSCQDELFNLRFRNSVKQLDNPLKIREVRRDMSRMLTLLREHEKGIRRRSAQELGRYP